MPTLLPQVHLAQLNTTLRTDSHATINVREARKEPALTDRKQAEFLASALTQ